MSTRATGTIQEHGWEEERYRDLGDGRALSRASVKETFEGDIEGEGTTEFLMMYRGEDSASFIGLEHVVGRIGDREGSFVLQFSGTYERERGTAEATVSVVPGSGTGELRGLRGEGRFVAPHGSKGSITLDYDFE